MGRKRRKLGVGLGGFSYCESFNTVFSFLPPGDDAKKKTHFGKQKSLTLLDYSLPSSRTSPSVRTTITERTVHQAQTLSRKFKNIQRIFIYLNSVSPSLNP